MSGEDRELIFFVLSSLMVAEERNHDAHVERARANVSDAFRHIFDEQLVAATSDAIREFAHGGLTRRLEIVGVPLSSL